MIETVKIKGEQINLERRYVIASTGFIIEGYDGYEGFKESTHIMGDDEAPVFLDTLFKVLSYPEKEIYYKEIQIYRERQEELTKKFIRDKVQDKMDFSLSVLDFVKDCGL